MYVLNKFRAKTQESIEKAATRSCSFYCHIKHDDLNKQTCTFAMHYTTIKYDFKAALDFQK